MILDAEILEQATQYIATQMTCSIFIPIRDPSLWIRKHYERWERK